MFHSLSINTKNDLAKEKGLSIFVLWALNVIEMKAMFSHLEKSPSPSIFYSPQKQ